MSDPLSHPKVQLSWSLFCFELVVASQELHFEKECLATRLFIIFLSVAHWEHNIIPA